ncbi:pectinesterase 2-like [Coffea arabica]|uniref:Pectinesterase n=1 Tax=Coffea arabica TaxID=13443 RepID=A0ABM4WPM6_COFAR
MSKTRPGAYRRIIDAIALAPIQSQSRYFIHVEAAAVKGNRFTAKYITLENSAGEATQAVALMSQSDRSSFYRCTFLGFHDTLCALFGRQFYECDIYGTVDFVFGNAAAGKRSRDEISGFVIQNSTLTAAPDLQSNKSQVHAFLGRPWFAWSTVIVMQSFLESIVDPAGWYEWPGHRTDELTYREYGNWGAGAGTGRRISWVGYKALNRSKEVIAFMVSKFIQADSWIPESGIPYTSGLY